MRKPTSMTRLASLGALALFSACSSWRPAGDYDGWSLYVRDGSPVAADEYRAAIEPALAAVEERMGPFRSPVRVHAWVGGVELKSGNEGEIREGDPDLRTEVPGIGPARVRAFHTRSGGWLESSGVFVGTADCGTAVHELVHARLADEGADVPLWFEEGYACLLGDGVLYEGRWIVDGFSCWPYRELREEVLSDVELARLLAITPHVEHSVRENVLVHFIGWAIVFDLARELESTDWRTLHGRFERAVDPLGEARKRMERSLTAAVPLDWLERARATGSPGARLSAVKGSWKLDSVAVVLALMRMLELESDVEVRAGIAVNLLAAAGPLQLPPPLRVRLWRELVQAMGDSPVDDPAERAALLALHRAYGVGDGRVDVQAELTALARFWEE